MGLPYSLYDQYVTKNDSMRHTRDGQEYEKFDFSLEAATFEKANP